MWTTKHTVILGSASVASLGVGCVSGWFAARRVLEKAYAIRLTEEIQQTKAFYDNLHKDDPEVLAEKFLDEESAPQKHLYDTTSDEVPTEVLERVASSMAKAQEELVVEAAPIGQEAVHNAFDNPAPAWVQSDEEMERRNGVPYIISHEEFYENQWEFEEGHLVYYEGDDTLADSRDEPIPEQYNTVGELTLEKFGHGSPDPNIVYVCNEKMEMIFEIARSTKSFAEDVLGFQHSETPRKFRMGRDE